MKNLTMIYSAMKNDTRQLIRNEKLSENIKIKEEKKTSNERKQRDVEFYWLAKEWIATAVYLKWIRNSVYYIENLSHSSIYRFFIF